ncbi:MAG: N-6 DNA methylase, partial [Flavipsychrobacter sp.]
EDATGDVFGKIYEYFLGEFALTEGQGGGEFFTPTSVVKLMVEIIEPYKGTIYDPACGSGGMFVQSAHFVERRRAELQDNDSKDLFVYGTEKTGETAKLAKMNLAINGLRGEIQVANTYYEDPFNSYGRFDFVMANPPFNVDEVILDKVKGQRRFNEHGIPQNKTKKSEKKKKEGDVDAVPNANYLWINLFSTTLNENGRAALVMANSASDARHSEAEIRDHIIKSGVMDVMLTLPKNMFYTVTLPATLWFFDKANTRKKAADRRILFIDARNIFRQVTRAHREFTDEHIQNIAAIVRLHRGESKRLKELLKQYDKQATAAAKEADKQKAVLDALQKKKPAEKDKKQWERELNEAEQKHKELLDDKQYYEAHIAWLNERFPNGVYEDVTGLCKSASLAEIAEQDYSLNPGRYVGVVIEEDGLTEEEFKQEMQERHERLKALNSKAKDLEKLITKNLAEL